MPYLDLLGQIGVQTFKIFFLTVSNFTFQLELSLEHLNVSNDLKPGDLDFDSKGFGLF